MEFNTNKRDALDEAVKPRAIKAQTQNWTLLEGYVYVISKKMPIKQNGKIGPPGGGPERQRAALKRAWS